jgi:hypothetical protein
VQLITLACTTRLSATFSNQRPPIGRSVAEGGCLQTQFKRQQEDRGSLEDGENLALTCGPSPAQIRPEHASEQHKQEFRRCPVSHGRDRAVILVELYHPSMERRNQGVTARKR